MEKIGICADHAGFEYKERLVKYLRRKGYEVRDFGTKSPESMDYPDVAHPMAEAVADGEVDKGISLCGTGNGISMTLNKHKGVRAALVWNNELSRLAKAHNNANVLSLPARFISFRLATQMINTWLSTSFEGGRHQRRIDKIDLK